MNVSSTATTKKSTLYQSSGRIPKTISYCAAFIALGLVLTSLGPTLPALARQTSVTLGQISYLFVARSLGYLLGSLLGGRLFDRIPGHPIMAAMLLVMALMMALVPFMPWLWLLIVVLIVMGLAEGTIDVGGNTMLVWVHRNKVGPFMNALHFSFGIGAFLAPVVIAQSRSISGGIAWAYWVLALLIAPIAFIFLRLPSPKMALVAGETSAKLTNNLMVVLIAVFFFLYVGMEASFGGWVFTYSVRLNLMNETMADYLTSAFWAALTLGRLLAIPIAARFRPRAIITANLAGALMSLGAIMLWTSSTWVVWLGAVGFGLSLASIFPTTLSLAERYLTMSGQTTRWFFVGASSGGMVIPWVAGQLFERMGPQAVMQIILIDLLLAITVFVALMARVSRSHMKIETE